MLHTVNDSFTMLRPLRPSLGEDETPPSAADLNRTFGFDLPRPLYCITHGGYNSVQFGTTEKAPHYGGASLATGSISLLFDLGRSTDYVLHRSL